MSQARERAAALLLPLTFLALAASPPALAAPAPMGEASLPWAGSEQVEVELRTVPFFAVDADGAPLLDLRADEVEVWVNGAPTAFDTFDALPAPGAAAVTRVEAGSPAGRQLILLFDLGFTSVNGVRRSQQVARELISRLTPPDRISVIANEPAVGMRVDLGPTLADAAGKAKAVASVDALIPKSDRLIPHADLGLPPILLGAGRNGIPTEQAHNAYAEVAALARAEYLSAVNVLTANLETFAGFVHQLSGTKVVVSFSSGVDDEAIFEGTVPFKGVGSTDAYLVDTRRFDPKVERFEKPLAALADAGAHIVFVNPDGTRSAGRNGLAYMRQRTGGLLLDNADARWLSQRLTAATTAGYMVGYYADSKALDANATVEVRLRRNGARAWAPARLVTRTAYRTLAPTETRLLIAQLVQHGLAAQALTAGGKGRIFELPGKVAGLREAEARWLVFEPAWPDEIGAQPVDLYDVLLAVEPGASRAEIVRFDRQEAIQPVAGARLRAAMPQAGALIWGVVAVEPATGTTYFRRFVLEAPAAHPAVATGPSR